MSALNFLVKVFVAGCLCNKFVAFAKYDYSNNWNNWIMFPAQSSAPFSRSYKKNMPFQSSSIPVYYNPALQDKNENISEPFVISIQSGRSVDVTQDSAFSEKSSKDLLTKFKEKKRTKLSETKTMNSSWYDSMTKFMELFENYIFEENNPEGKQQNRAKEKIYKTKGYKVQKQFKKFMVPLLLAYKLKFFTLIPVLIGGLILLVGSTGMAGFFFALFATVMSLKSDHKT